MALTTIPLFAFFLIALCLLCLTVVQSQSRGAHYLKRSHLSPARPAKRSAVKRDAPSPGFYSSLSCPSGVNCVEVGDLSMWVDKSQATNCAPGGLTCEFPTGSTVKGGCPDGSVGIVHIHDSYTNGDSVIEYTNAPAQIWGTFGIDTEDLETTATFVSAYLTCLKHID